MPTMSSKFRTSSKGGGGGGDDDEEGGGGGYQAGRLERVAVAATKQSLRSHKLKLREPTGMEGEGGGGG